MWKRYMLAILLFTSCMYLRPKQNSMSDLSQNDWAEGLVAASEAIVLDVRTEEEFESGFIPNAINIDIRMGAGFIDELNKLDKTVPYYVYCRSGARSAQAVQIMQDMGFVFSYNLLGGILAWEGEVME
jgi:rhodanese-related sulfurtransferase